VASLEVIVGILIRPGLLRCGDQTLFHLIAHPLLENAPSLAQPS